MDVDAMSADARAGIRSSWSIRFEVRMKACAQPGTIISLAAFDFGRFLEFASQMALIAVDGKEDRLTFRHVGAEFSQLFDHDLTGSNYLDIVAPSSRQSVFERKSAMLN